MIKHQQNSTDGLKSLENPNMCTSSKTLREIVEEMWGEMCLIHTQQEERDGKLP